jgi:hypothetical protein
MSIKKAVLDVALALGGGGKTSHCRSIRSVQPIKESGAAIGHVVRIAWELCQLCTLLSWQSVCCGAEVIRTMICSMAVIEWKRVS